MGSMIPPLLSDTSFQFTNFNLKIWIHDSSFIQFITASNWSELSSIFSIVD